MACKNIQSQIGFRKFNILIIKSSNSVDKNQNVRRDEEAAKRTAAPTFKLEFLIIIKFHLLSICIDIKVKPHNLIKISYQMGNMGPSMRRMISI
jgi:hypothetical protein